MKNLFLTLIFSLITLFSKSQTVCRAFTAELYTLSSDRQEWLLDTKISDLKVDITLEDEFISIHAKSPTMYRIFNGSKETVDTKSLQGLRYKGVDLKTNESVTIDVLVGKDSNIGVISIVNHTKNINFRYFVEK